MLLVCLIDEGYEGFNKFILIISTRKTYPVANSRSVGTKIHVAPIPGRHLTIAPTKRKISSYMAEVVTLWWEDFLIPGRIKLKQPNCLLQIN